MKSIASITCACTVLLLSSCSLNQQGGGHATDAAALQAGKELAHALRTEEKSLLDEARDAEALANASAAERAVMEARRKALTEELARQEAEAKMAAAQQAALEAQARVAEAEKARLEAEARVKMAEEMARAAQEKARERMMAEAAEQAAQNVEESSPAQPRRAQLFSSRGRRKTATELNPEHIPDAPTEQQQTAARKILAQQAKQEEKESTPAPRQEKARIARAPQHRESAPAAQPKEARLASVSSVTAPPPAPTPTPARQALRVKDFTLTDIDDEAENSAPLPNSIELRGLRSPLMGGQLPMNIDGKLNKKN